MTIKEKRDNLEEEGFNVLLIDFRFEIFSLNIKLVEFAFKT